MDPVLIAATGISAASLKNHTTLGLCSVAFFSALFNANVAVGWRGLRILIVLSTLPLAFYETLHEKRHLSGSVYLSFVSIALATGDSFYSSTIYPFLILLVFGIADEAFERASLSRGASDRETPISP